MWEGPPSSLYTQRMVHWRQSTWRQDAGSVERDTSLDIAVTVLTKKMGLPRNNIDTMMKTVWKLRCVLTFLALLFLTKVYPRSSSQLPKLDFLCGICMR